MAVNLSHSGPRYQEMVGHVDSEKGAQEIVQAPGKGDQTIAEG
jgi:hypothetical protein